MDPQRVRAWKAGYEAANRDDLDDARRRTPEERFRNLLGLSASLRAMGLLRERSDDLEYHLRWQELRERWLARKSGP